MKEITILSEPPVVFTKDTNWGDNVRLKPGSVVRLPDDAVLCTVPIYEITGTPPLEED